MSKSSNSGDRALAIAAMVTAMLALAVSIWQGLVTREHNRLSVQPASHIEYAYYDGSKDNKRVAFLEIENRGLGPGWISPIEVFLDCELVGIASRKTWMTVIDRIGLQSPWEGDWVEGADAMRPSQRKLLLKIWPSESEYEVARVAVSKRIGIQFTMCSFYDDSYEPEVWNAKGHGQCSN